MTPEQARRFEYLKVHLPGDRTDGGYARTAASLAMSEIAARTAVSRLKNRLGELVEDEVAHTVSTPEEIEDEIRYLLAAVGR
jgi:RNA polymerase sigma-70 factor (ECF subfamily)